MRDRCLQGIQTIVELQQCMPAESDDGRFVLDGQDRGLRLPWSGRQISDRAGLLPLRDRLRVGAVALGRRPQARLTILYCSTDRLRRCGCSYEKNLSRSASYIASKIMHYQILGLNIWLQFRRKGAG